MAKQTPTQTPTEALAEAQPPEKTRKARDRKDHAFLLSKCVGPSEEPLTWEFTEQIESEGMRHATEILSDATPGTYLLTKQVASLTVKEITDRKIIRS